MSGRALRALLAAAGLLAGCATSDVELARHYQPARHLQPRSSAPQRQDPACTFHIASFDDARSSPETLGSMLGRTVVSEDFGAWLRSGFATLPGYDAGQAGLPVRVQLLKAFTQNVYGSKATTLVIRMGYADAPPVMYRGNDNSINWANGEHEIRTSFDAALTDLLGRVKPDIAAACLKAPKLSG